MRGPQEIETRRLRAGRKVGRTLYVQVGDEPSDDDPLVGLMDTPELAAQVVALAASLAESEAREKTLREALPEHALPGKGPLDEMIAYADALHPDVGPMFGRDVARVLRGVRAALAAAPSPSGSEDTAA